MNILDVVWNGEQLLQKSAAAGLSLEDITSGGSKVYDDLSKGNFSGMGWEGAALGGAGGLLARYLLGGEGGGIGSYLASALAGAGLGAGGQALYNASMSANADRGAQFNEKMKGIGLDPANSFENNLSAMAEKNRMPTSTAAMADKIMAPKAPLPGMPTKPNVDEFFGPNVDKDKLRAAGQAYAAKRKARKSMDWFSDRGLEEAAAASATQEQGAQRDADMEVAKEQYRLTQPFRGVIPAGFPVQYNPHPTIGDIKNWGEAQGRASSNQAPKPTLRGDLRDAAATVAQPLADAGGAVMDAGRAVGRGVSAVGGAGVDALNSAVDAGSEMLDAAEQKKNDVSDKALGVFDYIFG